MLLDVVYVKIRDLPGKNTDINVVKFVSFGMEGYIWTTLYVFFPLSD